MKCQELKEAKGVGSQMERQVIMFYQNSMILRRRTPNSLQKFKVSFGLQLFTRKKFM